MADEASTCGHCGAVLSPNSRFCGSCGQAVSAGSERGTTPGAGGPAPGNPAASPAPAQPVFKGQTMLGLSLEEGGGLSPPGATSGPEVPAVPSASPEPPAVQPPNAPNAEPALEAPIPKGTMLGLPGSAAGVAASNDPPRDRSAAGAAPAVPSVGGAGLPKHTILGVSPSEQPDASGGPGPAGPFDPTAPSGVPARPMAGMPSAVAAGGTMLGLPNMADLAAGKQPTAPKAPATGGAAQGAEPGGLASGRTMLGVGLQGASGPSSAPPASTTQTPLPDWDVDTDERPSFELSVGMGRGLLVGLAALALLAVGAGVYALVAGGGNSDVQARVVPSDAGELMEFEVAGAPAGAKLRFGQQEKPLEAGRARFPLSADSLRVGENVVLAEVIRPGGEIESARILLTVDYRVTVDTSPLQAGEAAVDVVVSTVPGSKVLLDGKALALDDAGRGVRRDALDLDRLAAGNVVEHKVSYRITPPEGEASVGEVVRRIPVTLLQIDKPGLTMVTDRSAVDIAGAVLPGTKVTIDGKAVEVKDGRFLHRYPMPEPGSYKPRVEAALEGRAPRVAVLALLRVDDLVKAAEGFAADRSLTYAKIAQNPAIYRGQKVAFEARIYNLKVEGGRTVLQALARKCPGGKACPLWVTYPAATELTEQSWVRVLGTLAGEQQFRTEQDQIRRVPKVDAAFLLPATL